MLSLIFLTLSTLSAKNLSIEIKISKVHGLIRFIETISGESSRSPVLKKHFEKSSFNTNVTKKMVAEYHQLRPYLQTILAYNNKQFHNYSLKQIFQLKSAEVNTIKEFEQRIRGILPIPIHLKYIALLHKMMPIYRAYLFDYAYPVLKKVKKEFKKRFKQWDTTKLLQSYKQFYHSEWPEELPFVISLIPIPGKRGSTNAQSIGYFEALSFFVGDPDQDYTPQKKQYSIRYGIMIHETAHSLYHMRSKILSHNLNCWFEKSKDPNAFITAQYLDEGFATVLGNGIAQSTTEKTYPISPKGTWYSDTIIDGFAKALYPMTLNYIQNKKPIDQHYINTAITLFSKKFPNAAKKLATRIQKITVISTGIEIDPREVIRHLRTYFNIPNSSGSSPLNHVMTLNKLTDPKNKTMKFIIVKKQHLKQIKEIEEKLPLLKKLSQLLQDKTNVLVGGFDQHCTPWILIVADDLSAVKRGIKMLKKSPLIPVKPIQF